MLYFFAGGLQDDKNQKAAMMILAAAVICFTVYAAIDYAVLSSRQTYNSVEKMRKEMQGNWTYRGAMMLVVEEDSAHWIYADFGQDFAGRDAREYAITWEPSRGMFYIGGEGGFKAIVSDGGDTISIDGNEYERGGFLVNRNV